MEFPADVRCVALPCVLAASILQYLPFAKKPMAFPCHRVTQSCSRKTVFIGLAAEMAGLKLLPLCEAYPMNASCLVFLYFWKESKRSVRMGEVLACISALSAWALPFLDPADGRIPEPSWAGAGESVQQQVAALIDVMLSPRTCLYIVGLLLAGIGLQCLSGCLCRGESALLSCVPPALNFGVSALLLKALAQVVWALLLAPDRPEAWAALLCLVVLLLGVRSAAAAPLRRAVEAHDNLSVLAFYGVASGAMAAVTGFFIYGEMDKWSRERKLLYLIAALVHCWGMRSLAVRGYEGKGKGSPKAAADEETGAAAAPSNAKKARDAGKVLQMVDMPSRASSAVSADKAAGPSGASTAAPTPAEKPPSPLLRFNEPRTVDDDAEIEDQLFSRVFAGLQGGPDIAGVAGPAPVIGGGDGVQPQFDADFEEIMRRFEEDDKQQTGEGATGQPITELAESLDQSPLTKAVADVSPPSVLAFDAQALLDSSLAGQDDEDELLKSIEDIDLP